MLRSLLTPFVLVTMLLSTHVEAADCTNKQVDEIRDLFVHPEPRVENDSCVGAHFGNLKCVEVCKDIYASKSDELPDCKVMFENIGRIHIRDVVDGYKRFCADRDSDFIHTSYLAQYEASELKKYFPNTPVYKFWKSWSGSDDASESSSQRDGSEESKSGSEDMDSGDESIESGSEDVGSRSESTGSELSGESESGSDSMDSGSDSMGSGSEDMSSERESMGSDLSGESESESESGGAAGIQLQAGVCVVAVTVVIAFIM